MDIPESFFVQLLNESDADLNSLCRLCFSAEVELVPFSAQLRPSDSADFTVLSDLIYDCVQLKVEQDDNCPQNICHSCLNFLVGWSEFKEKCKKTNGLIENWHSIKSQVKVSQNNSAGASGKTNIKINCDQAPTRIKMSGSVNANEDYWILVVGDGSAEKSTSSKNCKKVISTGSFKNPNSSSSQAMNSQRIPKKPFQRCDLSKIVRFSSGSGTKLIKPNETHKDVDRIRKLIAENKYQMKNGCIVINPADLTSLRKRTANTDVSEIKSAGDLLRKTSFASDDEDNSSAFLNDASEVDPVDKIQRLIEENEAILETSAVKVKRAHAVFKTAETELQTNSTKSTKSNLLSSLKVPPNILRKNSTNSVQPQRSRKRKRTRGPQCNIAYQQNIVSCDVCGDKFFNYESLLYHDQTSHEDFPRLFSCDECNQGFLTEDHLGFHRASYHGNETSSEDEGGGKKEKVVIRLERSSSKTEDESNLGKIICGICDETFTSTVTLKKHLESCENSVLFV